MQQGIALRSAITGLFDILSSVFLIPTPVIYNKNSPENTFSGAGSDLMMTVGIGIS